jgi:soluble lytic murein transglycosylase-like protein
MIGVLFLGLVCGAYETEITAAVEDVRAIYPVPPALIRAVIRQESAWNPNAVSKVGAIGLMQVMPFNAKNLGLSKQDLFEPRLNILAGVRLLAVLLSHYEGDVIATLIAYNSGPKRKLSPIPKNGETPTYVLRILQYWHQEEAGFRVSR